MKTIEIVALALAAWFVLSVVVAIPLGKFIAEGSK